MTHLETKSTAMWDWVKFNEPGSVRHGLPPLAYTSEAFLEAEFTSVFTRGWVLAGFAHELGRPGDVVPATVAGQPILLVRNETGEIKAFHNVCRHRCLQLVDAPANVGRVITCPYHTWAYGLDGQLRATPHLGGPGKHHVDGFVVKDHGLSPVRSVVWGDWVFINLDGDAAPFAEYARPLIERLADIDFASLVPLATLHFAAVDANWKFLMENFIEPYHVPYVHKTTTNQPLADHRTFVDGPCLGSLVDLDRSADGYDALSVSSRYLTLFPNFALGRYHPDQLGVYLNVPVAAGVTAQTRVIYATGERSYTPEQIESLCNLWHDVHKEDHAMCERLQRGRKSAAAADGGRLSPHWEDSVRRFQELLLEQVSIR